MLPRMHRWLGGADGHGRRGGTEGASDRVGLVLSGGGARGAYEMGVLSVLLPELERRGERPRIITGTSVGAINAAFMAGTAQLPAAEQVELGQQRWQEVNKGRVVKPILFRQLPITALRYAGEILSLPGARVPSLLDPAPLNESLERWLEWPSLHHNCATGLLEAVAVIATNARSGRPTAFVEGNPAVPAAQRTRLVDYVPSRLGNEHVRASAAIPMLFPPVKIENPPGAEGWYFDGGTRLNTPIKPALDLGAERLVVVGSESLTPAPPFERDGDAGPPDFGEGARQMLHGMLVDPVIEDLRSLGYINDLFVRGRGTGGVEHGRQARGKAPYRLVPYVFIAPAEHGAIGRVAKQVFEERYGGVKGLRSIDVPLLSRLLGSDTVTHGDLLSYLFFEPEFVRRLIQMGSDDARRWLRERPNDLWETAPLPEVVETPPA